LEKGAYPQMPFEAINEEQYKEMVKDIRPDILKYALYGSSGEDGMKLKKMKGTDPIAERWCDNGMCEIDPPENRKKKSAKKDKKIVTFLF
ncbi:hypothetical protein HK096_002561, partial [Nowakowskiella sp. JEL0078]